MENHGSTQSLLELPLSKVAAQSLEWLWAGRIPLGKLTLLAGDPGLGKSFVSIDLAARVSRGGAWPDQPDWPQPPGRVILFSEEDDLADTIRPRLDRAEADISRITAVRGVVRCSDNVPVASWRFSLKFDLRLLESVLERESKREGERLRLIILDPISAYCGGTNSNNDDVWKLLRPLARLAEKYRVAILGITHLRKGTGGKAVHRALGALAFVAAARAVWMVLKDQNDPERRLMLPAKMNLSADTVGMAYRLDQGRVNWESETLRMSADEAISQQLVSFGDRVDREEAAAWLRHALEQGPLPAKEIQALARANGILFRALQRAKARLSIHLRRDGSGKGSYVVWALPDQKDQPAARASLSAAEVQSEAGLLQG